MSAYFSLFFFYLDIPCGQSLSTRQEHLSPHQLVSFQQMWVGQDFCTSFFACDLGFQTLYGIDKVLLSILNVLHCGKNIKTQEFQCHLLKNIGLNVISIDFAWHRSRLQLQLVPMKHSVLHVCPQVFCKDIYRKKEYFKDYFKDQSHF